MVITEEIYGKIVTFYHRTKTEDVAKSIGKTGFKIGDGDYYGPAVYGCFDLNVLLVPVMIEYGEYIVKSKTNLQGFLILDETIAKTVYGKDFALIDQFKSFCSPSVYNNKLSEEFKNFLKSFKFSNRTADTAKIIWERYLSKNPLVYKQINGLIYVGGEDDGDVIVVYDVNTIIPMGYAYAGKDISASNITWTTTFDAAVLQSVKSSKKLRKFTTPPSGYRKYSKIDKKKYLLRALEDGYNVIDFIIELGDGDLFKTAIKDFGIPIESVDPEYKREYGFGVDWAISANNPDALRIMLDAGYKPTKYSIPDAEETGNPAIIKMLEDATEESTNESYHSYANSYLNEHLI